MCITYVLYILCHRLNLHAAQAGTSGIDLLTTKMKMIKQSKPKVVPTSQVRFVETHWEILRLNFKEKALDKAIV